MKFLDFLNKKLVIYILSATVLIEGTLYLINGNRDGIITPLFVSFLFSASQVICLLLICYQFIPRLVKYRKTIEKNSWYKANLFGDLKSPIFLSFFRILHALVCMWLIIQIINEGYIDFKFFGNSDQNLFIITFFHYFWLFILILILFGTSRRIVYLMHFILSCCFFDTNIGDMMLKIAAFWSIFMIPQGPIYLRLKKSIASIIFGFDNKTQIITPLWSVFLLGINLSFLITISGLYKVLDPVWLEGLGFYFAFLQPWIRVPESTFLLDQKWFILVMNYLGIIFETLAFFFFPFKRLRPVSIFFMFCFLILVLYPLRIDPVAPAGLVILVAVLSMQNITWTRKSNSQQINIKNVKLDTTYFFLASILITVQFIVSTFISFKSFKYPFTSYPFELTSINNNSESKIIKQKNNDYYFKSSYIKSKISFIKFIYKFRVIEYSPIFNYNHSLARSAYFIDAYSESEKFRPFSIYNIDGTIDPYGLRGGFLRPLGLHTVYGQLGIIYYKLVLSKNIISLNDSDLFLLKRLFHFSNIKMKEKNIKENITDYNIRIYNIEIPNDYIGVYNGVSEKNFVEIGYNIKSKKIKIIKIPEKVMDFSKLNISLFKNGKIRFNPF